jgi:teichuronic acid biosynthesis glycosyltransferase TuaG
MSVPVSVIIPFYNGATHFEAALDSVAAQTRQPSEIIVIDDGSGPGAKRCLSAFAGRFRLITFNENRGPGPARNAGVAASSQEYIAFLDADDVWDEEKLESQYEFMTAWPKLDATHTNAVFFFADGRKVTKKAAAGALSIDAALAQHMMITPTVMMRRDSFNAVGGFDPRFRCAQDWELQIRMALAGFQIQFIDKRLTRVRREDHGNHSWNWSCYLSGHLRILLKHRREYISRIGYRRWIQRFAWDCYCASVRTSGWKRRLLGLPHRIGL